jgi:hypothetical protein
VLEQLDAASSVRSPPSSGWHALQPLHFRWRRQGRLGQWLDDRRTRRGGFGGGPTRQCNPSIDCIQQLKITNVREKIWLHDSDFHRNAILLKLKLNRIEKIIIVLNFHKT